jgi:hypothetical protein
MGTVISLLRSLCNLVRDDVSGNFVSYQEYLVCGGGIGGGCGDGL